MPNFNKEDLRPRGPELNNEEIRGVIAPFFEADPGDVVGFAIVIVDSDSRIRMVTNGNADQVIDLLAETISRVTRGASSEMDTDVSEQPVV